MMQIGPTVFLQRNVFLHVFCFVFRSLRQKPRLNGGQINYREEEKRILDSILGRDVYDNRIRPSGLNGTGMCNACNPFMHKSFYLTCFLFFRRGHHHCRQLIHSQFRQNRRRENGKLQLRAYICGNLHWKTDTLT